MMFLGDYMNTQWTLEKTFSSYEEALKYKTSLQMSERGATTVVKIKCYASINGIERYGVKTRTDPSLVKAIEEVEKKTSKKKTKG